MKDINIAIDGPAASGKSSVAKLLAKKLNFKYLDTGLMYRAFTYFCIQNKINLKDEIEIKKSLSNFNFKIDDLNNIFINENLINNSELISEIIVKNINIVSGLKFVRNKMIVLQKQIVKLKRYIIVGRDIGTIVLPDAEFKIFLTANVEKRAQRRLQEINDSAILYSSILNELIKRDEIDSSRKFGPLKKADDAILLDNSDLNLEETVLKIIDLLDKKGYKNE